MTINSDNAGPIFLATLAVFLGCAVLMWRRPDFRRNPALRLVTVVAVAAVLIELSFAAMLVLLLSGLPDMSEF